MGFFSKMFGKNVQKGKAELAKVFFPQTLPADALASGSSDFGWMPPAGLPPPATMPLERGPTPSCSLLRGAVGRALLS